MSNPFLNPGPKPTTQTGIFSDAERRLANRNHGAFLETLALDTTPIGAHYLLTHFDVPLIEEKTHQLVLDGAFDNAMNLTLDQIRARPKITMPVTLECGGNGRALMPNRNQSMPWGVEAFGTSEWSGTLLAPLLEEAQPKKSVKDFVFLGADYGFDGGVGHFYGRSLTPADIAELDVMLVYEMNGQPLLPQHGAPLRIIVPGWYGMASVKWLTRIEAWEKPFDGYQQVQTYRFRQNPDEAGEPVRDMRVRSLMVPPGVPDFVSRQRLVGPGSVAITGKAWSGLGRRITKVEFNDGSGWVEAEVLGRNGDYAWTSWRHDWHASNGDYVLSCRATDEAGNRQPLEPQWNLSAFGNNAVQRVAVTISDQAGPVPA